MKTILSALIISAFLTANASADQGKGQKGQKGQKGPNIDQVISSLQLDSNTATNLKTLMEKHRAERKAFRENGKRDRDQKQAARKQHRQALLKVLGYEKMFEFEELRKEHRSKNRSDRRSKRHSERKSDQ